MAKDAADKKIAKEFEMKISMIVSQNAAKYKDHPEKLSLEKHR